MYLSYPWKHVDFGCCCCSLPTDNFTRPKETQKRNKKLEKKKKRLDVIKNQISLLILRSWNKFYPFLLSRLLSSSRPRLIRVVTQRSYLPETDRRSRTNGTCNSCEKNSWTASFDQTWTFLSRQEFDTRRVWADKSESRIEGVHLLIHGLILE